MLHALVVPWSPRAEQRIREEEAEQRAPLQSSPSAQHHLVVACGALRLRARLMQEEWASTGTGSREELLPLDTANFLYVPSSFTLLAYLLPRRASLLRGACICELGSGLGMVSSVVQQLGNGEGPAELVATDGADSVFPMLRANLMANAGAGPMHAVVEPLRWGRQPEPLAGRFDLVVAADVVFHATPPQSTSRLEASAETVAMVDGLFASAAALLRPLDAGVRYVTLHKL